MQAIRLLRVRNELQFTGTGSSRKHVDYRKGILAVCAVGIRKHHLHTACGEIRFIDLDPVALGVLVSQRNVIERTVFRRSDHHGLKPELDLVRRIKVRMTLQHLRHGQHAYDQLVRGDVRADIASHAGECDGIAPVRVLPRGNRLAACCFAAAGQAIVAVDGQLGEVAVLSGWPDREGHIAACADLGSRQSVRRQPFHIGDLIAGPARQNGEATVLGKGRLDLYIPAQAFNGQCVGQAVIHSHAKGRHVLPGDRDAVHRPAAGHHSAARYCGEYQSGAAGNAGLPPCGQSQLRAVGSSAQRAANAVHGVGNIIADGCGEHHGDRVRLRHIFQCVAGLVGRVRHGNTIHPPLLHIAVLRGNGGKGDALPVGHGGGACLMTLGGDRAAAGSIVGHRIGSGILCKYGFNGVFHCCLLPGGNRPAQRCSLVCKGLAIDRPVVEHIAVMRRGSEGDLRAAADARRAAGVPICGHGAVLRRPADDVLHRAERYGDDRARASGGIGVGVVRFTADRRAVHRPLLHLVAGIRLGGEGDGSAFCQCEAGGNITNLLRTARHCAGDAAVLSGGCRDPVAQRHELYHNGLLLVNTSEHQLRPDEGRAALLVHLAVHAPFLHTVAVIRSCGKGQIGTLIDLCARREAVCIRRHIFADRVCGQGAVVSAADRRHGVGDRILVQGCKICRKRLICPDIVDCIGMIIAVVHRCPGFVGIVHNIACIRLDGNGQVRSGIHIIGRGYGDRLAVFCAAHLDRAVCHALDRHDRLLCHGDGDLGIGGQLQLRRPAACRRRYIFAPRNEIIAAVQRQREVHRRIRRIGASARQFRAIAGGCQGRLVPVLGCKTEDLPAETVGVGHGDHRADIQLCRIAAKGGVVQREATAGAAFLPGLTVRGVLPAVDRVEARVREGDRIGQRRALGQSAARSQSLAGPRPGDGDRACRNRVPLPIRQRGFSGGEGFFRHKGDRDCVFRLIQSGKGQFFLAVGLTGARPCVVRTVHRPLFHHIAALRDCGKGDGGAVGDLCVVCDRATAAGPGGDGAFFARAVMDHGELVGEFHLDLELPISGIAVDAERVDAQRLRGQACGRSDTVWRAFSDLRTVHQPAADLIAGLRIGLEHKLLSLLAVLAGGEVRQVAAIRSEDRAMPGGGHLIVNRRRISLAAERVRLQRDRVRTLQASGILRFLPLRRKGEYAGPVRVRKIFVDVGNGQAVCQRSPVAPQSAFKVEPDLRQCGGRGIPGRADRQPARCNGQHGGRKLPAVAVLCREGILSGGLWEAAGADVDRRRAGGCRLIGDGFVCRCPRRTVPLLRLKRQICAVFHRCAERLAVFGQQQTVQSGILPFSVLAQRSVIHRCFRAGGRIAAIRGHSRVDGVYALGGSCPFHSHRAVRIRRDCD